MYASAVVVYEDEGAELAIALRDGLGEVGPELAGDLRGSDGLWRVARVQLLPDQEKAVRPLVAETSSGSDI